MSSVRRMAVALTIVAAGTVGLAGTAAADGTATGTGATTGTAAPLGAPGAYLGSTVIDLARILHSLL